MSPGGGGATATPGSGGVSPTVGATSTPKPPLAQTSPETDREILVALYNATDGTNWVDAEHWLSDEPIGEWYGVITDGNGRVTELYLNANQLSGEIPPELGNLANLKSLYLGGKTTSSRLQAVVRHSRA